MRANDPKKEEGGILLTLPPLKALTQREALGLLEGTPTSNCPTEKRTGKAIRLGGGSLAMGVT